MLNITREEEKAIPQITYGKYYSHHRMPNITIEANYDHDGNVYPDGRTRTVGYLNSFRDYCFQVSGTYNGIGDNGSTPVFGLHTFGHILQAGLSNLNQEDTVKYFISAIAHDAICNFVQMESRWLKKAIKIMPNSKYTDNGEEWKKFIDNAYKKYVVGEQIDDVPFTPGLHVSLPDKEKLGEKPVVTPKEMSIDELERLCEEPKEENSMMTFRDLYNRIQKTDKLDNLQIYSNKLQVNVLNEQKWAIMCICFADKEAHVYLCHKEGIADYQNRISFNIDDSLDVVRNYVNGAEAYAILKNA